VTVPYYCGEVCSCDDSAPIAQKMRPVIATEVPESGSDATCRGWSILLPQSWKGWFLYISADQHRLSVYYVTQARNQRGATGQLPFRNFQKHV